LRIRLRFIQEHDMLCLLGKPAVLEDGERRPLALRPKALAVLAYLALTARAAPRRELARLVFPDAEEPLAALRWHLHHLRSAAPGFIATNLIAGRDRIGLAVPTDVALFRDRAVRICEGPGVAGAAEILALYRDDLLAGLTVSTAAEFDTWLYVEQEGLRRLFRRATVAFARAALGGERADEAVGPLARLVAVDPYFEDGHVLLIEAYEALGQGEHAATAYEHYQRIVRHDLQAEPRPALARRYEPSPPGGRTLPRDELMPLRQVTVHIVDWPGSEPTVVAIHGSGMIAHAFSALAEHLAPAHRFVALDLRGHGFSDKPPSGYDLDRHVEDVLDLIEALELRRPLLLGHSAGGTIAAFAAARADIAGLILLEGMIGDRAFAENAAALAAPLAGTLDQRFGGFDEYLVKSRAGREPWSDEAERLVDRWARYDLAPLPDGTYRRRALRSALEAEWASIIEADSLAALARVACPILVVQALQPWMGGRPYFTDAIVEAQLRAAPRAQLFVARHSTHNTIVRDPEPDMIEAIMGFVRRCSQRRPTLVH
jgi:pimeloyl-ACP methyl ester carboxylesterase